MSVLYPLIEYGSGVYATSDGLIGGDRCISEITGLEVYQLAETVGTQRALDGTIYSQYQTVKDTLITIRFPLMTTARYDALRDVVQAAITGNTTYALNITSDMGNFTFTAKPAENPISISQSILSGYVANVEFRQYCTD